jgi:dienelactone hydrolase
LLEAEVEYSIVDGDIVRERVVFDSEENMSVPCHVLYPKGMKKDKSAAAIVCVNGHGPFGKDPVAGIASTGAHRAEIQQANYDYARQMAQAGFFTIAPDLRGFGERADGGNPFPGRDACNVNYVKGSLMGRYPLTLNIWDMKCCIDYLETRPEVNPARIGMMGLSQGGTMTTFTTAVEPRIKAADIIAYVNPFAGFGIDRANFCGSQVVPHLYQYLDTHDVAGLIAPRPLLIEMGIYDNCFFFQDLTQGYTGVERIYEAAKPPITSLLTSTPPGMLLPATKLSNSLRNIYS